MSIAVTSWLRAFFALREHAMDCRGFVEMPDGDDEVIRWPRTLGADVVAITGLLDPSVRAQPLRFGGRGLARRWRACVDDVALYGARAPADEYIENRTFWRALPALCVYLHAQAAALPSAPDWCALLARLGATPIVARRTHHG